MVLYSIEGKQRRLHAGKLAGAGQSGGVHACVKNFDWNWFQVFRELQLAHGCRLQQKQARGSIRWAGRHGPRVLRANSACTHSPRRKNLCMHTHTPVVYWNRATSNCASRSSHAAGEVDGHERDRLGVHAGYPHGSLPALPLDKSLLDKITPEKAAHVSAACRTIFVFHVARYRACNTPKQ